MFNLVAHGDIVVDVDVDFTSVWQNTILLIVIVNDVVRFLFNFPSNIFLSILRSDLSLSNIYLPHNMFIVYSLSQAAAETPIVNFSPETVSL